MNDDTTKTITPNITPSSEAPNKDFFKEAVQAILPEDKIKQKLGDLDQEWTDDRVEPVKTLDDQEKLLIYEKLQVAELPFDWKIQLERLNHLEKQQVDYNQIKEELTGWTDTFGIIKPQEVENGIKELTEKLIKTEAELKTWKDIFGDQTAEEVEGNRSDLVEKYQLAENVLEEWDRAFMGQSAQQVKQIEKELNEWKQTWGNRELTQVKEEWEILNKRPPLTITAKQFFDDYARRKPLAVGQKETQELIKAKEQLSEVEKENGQLWKTIREFLAHERTRRYVVVEPIIPGQTEKEIVKLLDKTEREWADYLQTGNTENYPLSVNLKDNEEKKEQAQQILTWIAEAKNSQDYQQLFEKWSGGKEYNDQYDFDGSLYLLKKYLEKIK